jgi:hypothetical protein
MPASHPRSIIFLFVFLCTSFTEISPSASLEPIKVASTGPGISTLPLEIAALKGFFRAEGLDVLTITMRANIAVNALLTRNVEFATPSTSVIKTATAGLPVKLIAVLLGRPDYFLTVRKEIKSVRDLKGKRIAIGTFGAAADLALRAVARDEGLDAERDLIRLQMGGAASRYASLVAGTVDATILTLPYNLERKKPAIEIFFGSASEWNYRCRGLRCAMRACATIPSKYLQWFEPFSTPWRLLMATAKKRRRSFRAGSKSLRRSRPEATTSEKAVGHPAELFPMPRFVF